MKTALWEKWAILLFVTMGTAVYTAAIFVNDGGFGENYWAIYLLKMAVCCVTGVLFGIGCKSFKRNKKCGVVLFALGILVSLVLLPFLKTRALWVVYMITVTMLPEVMLLVAKGALRLPFFNFAAYLAVSVGIIYIIEEVLSPWRFHWRDIAVILYMGMMSAFVWRFVKKEKGEKSYWWFGGVIVIAVLLFHNHRLWDIVLSFKFPGDTYTGLEGVNWLQYRMEIIKNAWMGDFSLMELGSVVPTNCPMMWINKVLGTPWAIMYLIFLAGSIIMAVRLLLKSGGKAKLFCMAVVLRSILKIFAEMLLITGTTVGSCMDMALIMLLLVCLRRENDGKPERIFRED